MKILENVSKKYQTLLFSATITDSLKQNQLFTLNEDVRKVFHISFYSTLLQTKYLLIVEFICVV